MLGAEGGQIGTRFALTAESSANEVFKDYCLHLEERGYPSAFKKLAPVRLVRNNFRSAVEAAEAVGASEEELRILLGLRPCPNVVFLKVTWKKGNWK